MDILSDYQKVIRYQFKKIHLVFYNLLVLITGILL